MLDEMTSRSANYKSYGPAIRHLDEGNSVDGYPYTRYQHHVSGRGGGLKLLTVTSVIDETSAAESIATPLHLFL